MGAPSVLGQGAMDFKGSDAKMSVVIGAMAVSDLVKSTLGPKGMDKILQSQTGDVTVTNDGATILRRLTLDNPAAKILVDISKTQDEEVGDGTTTVCILAGSLLAEADPLLNQRIHPQTIIQGWRLAVAAARKRLEEMAWDFTSDPEAFRKVLFKIAKTTLSSKIVHNEHDQFANICVDAILRLKGSGNLENVQILKKCGGSMKDSFLAEGFILDKKIGVGQPKRMENAKILVANTPMDTDKVKIYGAKVKVDSMTKVAEIEAAELAKMMAKCEKIANHGCDVFINRQLIYNKPEQYFADRGIMAIEHADFEGVERLSKVLGGDIVSTFDHPELVKLGGCKLIEEIMIGEDRMIQFSGCAGGEACTIVLRGASMHLLDEAERSVHDALCVLATVVKDPRAIYGGGCSEIAMAEAVDELAKVTPGKKSLAIEAFGRALRALPKTIAENGGYDATELVTQLRAAQVGGQKSAGLDMQRGAIADMAELGITESFRVKCCSLVSASEAAEMIIRVDEVVTCAPRQRQE
jgi:T-complex protein 1 subunit beta